MYAILAQCVTVQTVLQTMFVLTTIARSVSSEPTVGTGAHIADVFLTMGLRQFYEMTWACVSHLRFVLFTAQVKSCSHFKYYVPGSLSLSKKLRWSRKWILDR